ncbi:MAG: DUF1491 family protein [Pseudomonadota bacterium]
MSRRLRSDIRINAILRTAQGAGGFGVVLHKGHEEAGIIYLLHRTKNIYTLLVENSSSPPEQSWRSCLNDASVEEVEKFIAKERQFDRDLWVVEVEECDLTLFLDS